MLHETLPSVTCPEMNKSQHFLALQSLREAEKKSVLLRTTMTATNKLPGMFILGHVTLSNDPCNLCDNDAMKLRDKLQETLRRQCNSAFKGLEVSRELRPVLVKKIQQYLHLVTK